MDRVVLVDEADRPVGETGKMEAHRQGLLHRALSVFVFNSKGDMLLQRRADGKYHSAGLWSNTCCSHPRPGEPVERAARRRLVEEMGIEADLSHVFWFVYRARFDNGLVEHELDHVFIGRTDAEPRPDPVEASAWRYQAVDAVRAEVRKHPERFTVWFRLCLDRVVDAASSTPGAE